MALATSSTWARNRYRNLRGADDRRRRLVAGTILEEGSLEDAQYAHCHELRGVVVLACKVASSI